MESKKKKNNMTLSSRQSNIKENLGGSYSYKKKKSLIVCS
jgi:hypothetical protein